MRHNVIGQAWNLFQCYKIKCKHEAYNGKKDFIYEHVLNSNKIE